MSSNNIKLLLKEARETLKSKDYQSTIKTCKSILKYDKNNYMALVFLGISLQETGNLDQAKKAFMKAIELNSENVLAWNGLLNYYEKLNSNLDESALIEIYLKILELETNDKKLKEICEKVESIKVIPENQFPQIVKAMYKAAKLMKEQNCVNANIWSAIVNIIWSKKDRTNFSEEINNILEESLSELVNKSQWMNIDFYSKYIKILYQRKKYEIILQVCKRMHSFYEDNVIPLEWVCKLFNELQAEENELSLVFESTAKEYHEILEKINPKSIIVLFTKSVVEFRKGNFIYARDILNEVLSTSPDFVNGWVLLTSCNLILNNYETALKSCEKAFKCLSKSSIPNDSVINKRLIHLNLEILSKHSSEEKWKECITKCEKMNENSDFMVRTCLLRSYINLNKLKEANNLLQTIENVNEESIVILRSKLLQKEEKYDEALQLLMNVGETNNSDVWFEIGLLYWKREEFDKSAVPFLKAAKLNPNSYYTFLYLGHYYKKNNNIEKAKKCYEKAFKLNNCVDAALELNTLYRQLGDRESNLVLLKTFTGESVNEFNNWAWVQLGVSYLENRDFNQAIDTWRYLVRRKPSNSHFWEGLADSYLARGSYNSALKCYEKAAEITPNSMYPLLQIATVKKVLGEFTEAKKDFQNILTTNQTYVPALKGLAETCLNQARFYDKKQLIGLSRDCCQIAADSLVTAINERSDFSCLWKLLGDCCYIVAQLPTKYCCLLISGFKFDKTDNESSTVLEMDDLYLMATRCYSTAISLTNNNILIWHDLASCFLSHAKNTINPQKAKTLYDKALAAVNHCTKENPLHWEHWNLLGNIAISKDPSNYALAQHAFIKAVTVDQSSAEAWSNLGTLYLKLDEFKLANKAFAKAQRADPTYVNSWVGQALIAELMNAEEAMDLFRHSTQLGLQMQGALGYGHWVCQTLIDSTPHQFIYAIHKMYAIPVACDALTHYVERNPYDSCAWNMLGLLRERLGLKKVTLEAFRNAYKKCIEIHSDKAKINLGRILFRLGNYEEAINYFQNVKVANFKSGSGLALSKFKAKQFEESYEAYESALHWLTEEQSHQSDILVALASMAYTFQGIEAAKTLLFQSVKCDPPSPFAYYAILALGLLHDDQKLSEAAVKEINKLKDKKECLSHNSILLSDFYLLKGEISKAIREISKLIHRHPNESSLWLSLSILFARFNTTDSTLTLSASNCAKIVVELRQNNVDIKLALCVVSLLCTLANEKDQALKAAQKAVHCYPDLAECWSVLIFTLSVRKNKSKVNKEWLKKTIEKTRMLDSSSDMRKWLENEEKNIDIL